MLLLLLFAVQMHAKQVYYVKPVATGLGDGSSWDNAGDLKAILTNAIDGSQVWVQQGLYEIDSSIVITHSISVYGGFFGSETLFSQRNVFSNNYSILHSTQAPISSMLCVNVDPYNGIHPITAINHFELDGFYLENAFAPSAWGGALRVESVDNLILQNIVVRYCQAFDGGGMYLENIPNGYMERVLFWGNVAENLAGGLFVSDCSDFTMVSTAFTYNNAYCYNSPTGITTFGSAGFFFEYSRVNVHHMTLTQNEYGKGGCVAHSTVHFNNSISYPDSINIEFNHYDTVYYDHCCLWITQHLRLQGLVRMPYLGNWLYPIVDWDNHNTVVETNIFSSNPQFNLNTFYPYPYLQSTSPCIDAGCASFGTPFDILWLPREVGNAIDMGAMEFQGQ